MLSRRLYKSPLALHRVQGWSLTWQRSLLLFSKVFSRGWAVPAAGPAVLGTQPAFVRELMAQATAPQPSWVILTPLSQPGHFIHCSSHPLHATFGTGFPLHSSNPACLPLALPPTQDLFSHCSSATRPSCQFPQCSPVLLHSPWLLFPIQLRLWGMICMSGNHSVQCTNPQLCSAGVDSCLCSFRPSAIEDLADFSITEENKGLSSSSKTLKAH